MPSPTDLTEAISQLQSKQSKYGITVDATRERLPKNDGYGSRKSPKARRFAGDSFYLFAYTLSLGAFIVQLVLIAIFDFI